jgi:hypothetical protein
LALLLSSAVADDTTVGTFNVPRNGTCRAIAGTSSTDTIASDTDCLTFSWEDYAIYTETYTSFTDEDGDSYDIYMGTLPVEGDFSTNVEGPLYYECPPDDYNGFDYDAGAYCETSDTATVMIFYVGSDDGLLWGFDIILSGYPFPDTLTSNDPPFGVAKFEFETGVTIEDTGSFQLCDTDKSKDCLSKWKSTREELAIIGVYSSTG